MKGARRWAVNVLRVVFSLALLYVAYRMIHFEDVFVVRHGGRRFEVPEAREDGESYRIVLEGAEQRVPKSDVERKEGFLSLFGRMDRLTYFLIAPVFLVSILACSVRWWILLRAHGFPVGLGSVFSVTYMGGFFNNFLPGSVGGDIARAMIAAKGEERKASLVGTIFLDRIIGLAAMILMAAVCLLPFVTDVSMRTPVFLVGGLFFGMVLGYLFYFSRTLRGLPWIQRIKRSGKVGEIVRDLDGALKILKHRKDVVLGCVLLSLVAQSATILGAFWLARGLGVGQVSLLQFFVFEPIIFIVTAVPVSAGGWGVQEGAYAFLFGRAGVPPNQAVAVSVLFKLTVVFISLPGGILFALRAARRRREGGAGAQVGGAAGDVPAHE